MPAPPTIDQQSEFYDRKWSQRSKNLNRHEISRLAKILLGIVRVMSARGSHKDDLMICDLGCGTGWLANELQKFGTVTAVDLSPEAIKQAAKCWPEINFVAADILKYRPEMKFDLVVSSEVIEHVQDKIAFMETVDNLLKCDGFMILTCPNGKIRKYFGDEIPNEQPIEEWPNPSNLKAIIRQRMVILHFETFWFNFSHSGAMRILNSTKLANLFNLLHFSGFFDALRSALNFGLYQIVVAKKRL